MEIVVQKRLLIGASLLVALVAGWQIGNESLLVAGVVGGTMFLWLANWLTGVPVDAFMTGCILFGYIVGNRGFAQAHVSGLPILPAELTLGLAVLLSGWRAARSKRLPLRRDWLNLLLFAWMVAALARLKWDLSQYGFWAVRDFAMIYYAAFFFLAQDWAADPRASRWIRSCLTVAFAAVAPVALAFSRWPDFFITHSMIAGAPLIYVKSDVAGGLMAAGLFWFLGRYRRGRNPAWLIPAAVNFAGVGLGDSRGALLAVTAGCLWPLACRDWRTLRPMVGMAGIGLAAALLVAVAGRQPWTETSVYRLYESVRSVTDVKGANFYQSAELNDKPDNNQFRLTWWVTITRETLERSPWLGLGFGYDLADRFVPIYYGEDPEDFTARSPHNFLLTVFGRMGLLGLAIMVLFLVALAARTWRAGREAARSADDGENFSLWLAAWCIFISACVGVVLEGPMGAVAFWTVLGLANASGATKSLPEGKKAAAPAETLQTAAEDA